MKTKLLAGVFVFVVAAAAHAQISDQQIVNNAFPTTLNDGDGRRFSRFIVVDLNRDGHPVLVAVYTNLARGAICVINRAGQVLAAPALPGMRGFHANVQAIDLDADGTPEIIAEFTTGHSPDNPDTWVFRWTGTELQRISPTCAVGNLSLSCLGRVSLLDLNGDGKLSLLDWPTFTVSHGTVMAAGDWTLYTLSNGIFQSTPDRFIFFHQFSGHDGAPFTSRQKFSAAGGAATLRVINGTGAAAVTSGHVTFNGAEILAPADFKRNRHTYDVPVALGQQNSVSVRLDSKPGSKISVLVTTAVETSAAGAAP